MPPHPFSNNRQKPGSYPGGMKQRFGVALALPGNPKLIIVDEPTAGLDRCLSYQRYNFDTPGKNKHQKMQLKRVHHHEKH